MLNIATLCVIIAQVCILCLGSDGTAQSFPSTTENILAMNFSFPPLNVASSEVTLAQAWTIPSINSNIRALASARNPFVLTNHSANTWPALTWNFLEMHQTGRWTDLFGVASFPIRVRAICNAEERTTDPSLFFSQAQGTEGSNIRHNAPGSSATNSHIVNQMSMKEFIGNISFTASDGAGEKKRRFLYSTEYDSLESELQLGTDTAWQDLLIDESHCNDKDPCPAPKPSATASNADAASAGANPADHPSPLLHLLHPGVALQARYSEYHTVRVQLQGKGRYYLFPPQHAPHPLHVYPTVHQHTGQAQVDLYREGGMLEASCPAEKAVAAQQQKQHKSTKHPPAQPFRPIFKEYAQFLANATQHSGTSTSTSTPAIAGTVRVAELNSGEVLYIPPYWSVHSEATTFSALLDVVSVSLEQQTLAPAYFLQLPFAPELTQTKDQRVVAAQVLLVHLLSRVHGVASVYKVAQALYHSRYAPMFPENGLFLRRTKFHCLRDKPELYDSIVSKLDPKQITAAASFIAARVNSPFFAQGRPQSAAKWVWLAAYMEKLARWAMMGDGELAVLFLRECLYMDEVLPVIEEVLGPDTVTLDPKENK